MKTCLFIGFFLLTLSGFSQQTTSDTVATRTYVRNDNEHPLYIVGKFGKTYNLEDYLLDPHSITNINVLQKNQAIEKYGDEAKDGAIEISLPENMVLYSTPALLKRFGINEYDKNLPICVNEQYLATSARVMVDANLIKEIKIVKGIYWRNGSPEPAEKEYINIIKKEPAGSN